MYYQTYSALYTVRTELSWFGAKVGHSQNSIKRVNGFMSNMDLQDLFVLPVYRHHFLLLDLVFQAYY